MKIEVFAKCTQEGDYNVILSYINFGEDIITSPEDPSDLITMSHNDTYGGLNKATINVNVLDLTCSAGSDHKQQGKL